MKYPAAHDIAQGLRRGGAWALAPWMRRRLIRAGDAGELDAIDSAWRAWLARPRDAVVPAVGGEGPAGLSRTRRAGR